MDRRTPPRSIGNFLRQHETFLLVLLLFVAFRLLAILLMRPGGFFADTSDYDFYMDWGEQSARGYVTFETLWTAYPPLFARLMLPVAELASRVPPWLDQRLAFHTLFGAFLLLFETGNLILLYRLSGKLARDEGAAAAGTAGMQQATTPGRASVPIHPVLFYALLFVPVHTLLGWFEAMPLFFLLLGLDLLLTPQRWGWPLSAVAMAMGFLVKLTPVVLLPVAIRTLGARLSLEAARQEWFSRHSPANLLRPLLYTLIAGVAIVGGGWLLLGGETSLAVSSFRVNSIRPPWQSIWAILDGYWGYGWVPLDMRNLDGLQRTLWETRLPWTPITVGFLTVYLWLYTRRYDWSRTRTVVAFAGVSSVWIFLYSKGWSPQFLVWILAFLALLMPMPRGVGLALALSLINVVEAYVYLILLPNERWILVGTVTLRTLLLTGVAAEFLAQIWPGRQARSAMLPPEPGGTRLQMVTRIASWLLVAATLIAAVASMPRMASAYGERRLAEHPCREAVDYLRAETPAAPNRTIAMTQIELWRNFYPWLHNDYTLRVIDGYTSTDRPVDRVISERLTEFAGSSEFWWLHATDGTVWPRPNPDPVALPFFDEPDVRLIERLHFGTCGLDRMIRLQPGSESARAEVDGGPIRLLRWETGATEPGTALPVVLYWQADDVVAKSYTVFTQLFDQAGTLVAQQDNLPVRGLAPTNLWEPGIVIRDPYLLALPATPGTYRLLVGLYDESGTRAILHPASGGQVDALEIPVIVPAAAAHSAPE